MSPATIRGTTEGHVDVPPKNLMGRTPEYPRGAWLRAQRASYGIRWETMTQDWDQLRWRPPCCIYLIPPADSGYLAWHWHFIWISTHLASATYSVHVSQTYVRSGRTSVWYTRTLVGEERFQLVITADLLQWWHDWQCKNNVSLYVTIERLDVAQIYTVYTI